MESVLFSALITSHFLARIAFSLSPFPHTRSSSINIHQRASNHPLPSLLSNLFQNMLIQGRLMRHKQMMGHYCDRAAGGEKPLCHPD